MCHSVFRDCNLLLLRSSRLSQNEGKRRVKTVEGRNWPIVLAAAAAAVIPRHLQFLSHGMTQIALGARQARTRTRDPTPLLSLNPKQNEMPCSTLRS